MAGWYRCSKWANVVTITTIMTLMLQLLLLYKNQCLVRDARMYAVGLTPDQMIVRNDTSPYPNRLYISTAGPPPVPRSLEDGGAKQPTHKRRLTIGIPTIWRPNENYFQTMLTSMLNKTSRTDLESIVFVVFLADLGHVEWKTNMEASIKSNYTEYVTSGSLQVIQAPAQFYDYMFVSKNDSYLNWRTKQNYDYAYLMKYCEHLSDYYMQMEDDVIASDGYFNAIMNFVTSQPDENWVCLEFSSLGFIGKLYHSPDIGDLSGLILKFNYSQPVDYLLAYFNMLTGKRTALRKPTLFQHLGLHSSLDKKVQPLLDRFFDFPEKTHKGDNPAASIQTTFSYTPDFPPELAYSKDAGFFWSTRGANAGDIFIVIFATPQTLKSVQIETSSATHPDDKPRDAVLEASPYQPDSPDNSKCNYFIVLDTFKDGTLSVDNDVINDKLGNQQVKCLQIRFQTTQEEWLVIREIAVFIDDTPKVGTS